MYKVVVLRNKPIAFLTSSLPSPSSLLKLRPNPAGGGGGGWGRVAAPYCGTLYWIT